jgi:hypothetical protein
MDPTSFLSKVLRHGALKFAADLQRDLAAALHVPVERIDVTSLTAAAPAAAAAATGEGGGGSSVGAVRAGLTLLDDTAGQPPPMLLRELQLQLADPEGPMRRGRLSGRVRRIQAVSARGGEVSSSRGSEAGDLMGGEEAEEVAVERERERAAEGLERRLMEVDSASSRYRCHLYYHLRLANTCPRVPLVCGLLSSISLVCRTFLCQRLSSLRFVCSHFSPPIARVFSCFWFTLISGPLSRPQRNNLRCHSRPTRLPCEPPL